ncbi:MAG: RNB domain-containing ribonuclease, partial [Coriobacteriia bacterium]|nr:RNB domain-containing ribonuclease [Coriobacteriia bacterium]
VGMRLRRRTPATHAIEEAMILANRLIAEWLLARGLPCVFRVHDAPDGESLYTLYQVLSEMPQYADLDEWRFCSGDPKVLQQVLSRAKGKPEHELVSMLLLRSMKRAVYSTEDRAHFGVALEHYCHFTSPIRRYPDLLVHRMAKIALFGETETSEAQKHALSWMAEHASKRERIAEKAAFESQQFKLVEYLQKDIGTRFEGIICGVSTFGVFVQLENTATGHLPLRELGDEHFSFDPDRYLLVGVDTQARYQLGSRLSVVLVGANPHERRLSFRLATS